MEAVELGKLLNADLDDQGRKAILSVPPPDILSMIENRSIDPSEQVRLISIIRGQPGFLPILVAMSQETGFGHAVAAEVLKAENWNELQNMVGMANFKTNLEPQDFRVALGRLLGTRSLFSWGLKVLFSKSVLRAMSEYFRDPRKAVRVEAIRAMSALDIADTKPILIDALGDADELVRKEALRVLSEKLDAGSLADLAISINQEEKVYRGYSEQAAATIAALPEKIPGIGPVVAFMKMLAKEGPVAFLNLVGSLSRAATSLRRSASVAADSAGTAFNNVWLRLRSDTSASREDPLALCGIYAALAWADGVLEDQEKAAIAKVAAENGLPIENAVFLDRAPTLEEVAALGLKLRDSIAAVFIVAGAMNVPKDSLAVRELVEVFSSSKK